MKINSHFLLVGILLCFLSACKSGPPKNLKAFEPLANQTIIAGTSWGDLVLGETTLADVIQKYGSTVKIAINLSDETDIELIYGEGQVHMVFPLDQSTSSQLYQQFPQWYKTLAQDPGSITQMPDACQDAPLRSLSLSPGLNAAKTLFKGATDHGLHFWQPLEISDTFFQDNDLSLEARCCKVHGTLAGYAKTQQQKLVQVTAWTQPGMLIYTAPQNQQAAEDLEDTVRKYIDSEQQQADQNSLKDTVKILGQNTNLARITIFEPEPEPDQEPESVPESSDWE